jgi:hypothetical protein
MLSTGNKSVHVKRFIRKLHGGSDPVLVLASDGLHYVVKFGNNLQGPNVLFNESAGTELYQACGLSTPAWKPLLVSNSFLDQNPGAWMETNDGLRRPDAGLCYGSIFMAAGPGRTFEILHGSALTRILNRSTFWLAWLLDACADHVDNRQAIFKEDASGSLHAFFIDHGHLFGGPAGKLRLPIIASRYLDPRIYPDTTSHEIAGFHKMLSCIDTDALWRRANALPEEWKTPSALEVMARALQSISDSFRVQSLLDRMQTDIERSTNRAIAPARVAPVPIPAPLYPDLQRNALGNLAIAC